MNPTEEAIERALQTIKPWVLFVEDKVQGFRGEREVSQILTTLADEVRELAEQATARKIPSATCTTCGVYMAECASCTARRFAREKALPAAKELAMKHGPDAIQWLGNALQGMLNPKEEDDRGRTRRS